MNFLFAWRYFKAKKTTNAINVISWISIVAIIIGTTSLILVLSVFNGFEGLVKSLYSSFYPDVRIGPTSGKLITLTEAQLAEIRRVPGIKALSLVVEERALLQNRAYAEDSADYQSIIYLKGVDAAYTEVTDVAEGVSGSFDLGSSDEPLLVVGAGIQNAVGIMADRNVRPLAVYMPRKGEVNLTDPLQSLSAEAVNTSGAFTIQLEFDNKYAITNLPFVKRMLSLGPDQYSAAELAVLPDADADETRDRIREILGKGYLVQNRFEQNASLYSVMRIEKWIIYAILSLILVVAAFNMVGALTMLVLDKKMDIGVLHAMGASRSFIRSIFLSEGLLLGAIGGGVGMVLAFLLCTAQTELKLVPLGGNTFMIEHFPVKMVFTDFLLVGATVLFIALLAAYLPARKASLQQYRLRGNE